LQCVSGRMGSRAPTFDTNKFLPARGEKKKPRVESSFTKVRDSKQKEEATHYGVRRIETCG
jgi:hypothetical protein